MKRNVLIDRLKGYACFLVLFGHVIMGIRNAGIYIPSFFFGTEKFIWSFHVALFLFLSGAVYALTNEWRNKKTKLNFITYKFINLGVPYVIFSVVYIFINSISGQANTQSSLSDILNIWKEPVAQYWFLYALFFLFCIWTIFSGILKNYQITLILVIIGYTVPMFGSGFGMFDVVIYSALAFGLGTFVNVSQLSSTPVYIKIIIPIVHLITGIILVIYDLTETAFVKEFLIIFGIYSSIQLISLLQKLSPVACFLDFMNKYSFQTYLLHTIFTAGIRVILLRINIDQWWIHILLGCIGGLGFSVLAAIIAKKIKILNACFFPTATFAKKKS